MRFLFATDFHGDEDRYLKLGDLASELGAAAIVIGGDIAPKFVQDIFVDQANFYGWMREWADGLMIPVYAFLGNDDVKCLLDVFLEECQRSRNLHALSSLGEIEGYTYARYNYVPDTPFGLKDWSKLDYKGWASPEQLGRPVLSECVKKQKDGTLTYRFRTVKDLREFLLGCQTIEQDMKTIGKVDILFAHCPPANVSLGVCYGGQHVGSHALLDWIDTNHPAISLHGHIHESYQQTGIWRVRHRGSTEMVQPGSRHCVVVDLERDPITGICEVHTELLKMGCRCD